MLHFLLFFFQAEDGRRFQVRSRGLGEVYKRQIHGLVPPQGMAASTVDETDAPSDLDLFTQALFILCLLYTSDAADERSSVDLGGRRIIKKKN